MISNFRDIGHKLTHKLRASSRTQAQKRQELKDSFIQGWIEPQKSAKWRGFALELTGAVRSDCAIRVLQNLPAHTTLTLLVRSQPTEELRPPSNLPNYVNPTPLGQQRLLTVYLLVQVPLKSWIKRQTEEFLDSEHLMEIFGSRTAAKVMSLPQLESLLDTHEHIWTKGGNHPELIRLYSLEAAPGTSTSQPFLEHWLGPKGLGLTVAEEGWLSVRLSEVLSPADLTGSPSTWSTYATAAVLSANSGRLRRDAPPGKLRVGSWTAHLLEPGSALAWGRAPLRHWCAEKSLMYPKNWSEPLPAKTLGTFLAVPSVIQPSKGRNAPATFSLLDDWGQAFTLDPFQSRGNPHTLILGACGSGMSFNASFLALSSWTQNRPVLYCGWERLPPQLKDATKAHEVSESYLYGGSLNPFWGFVNHKELLNSVDILAHWLANLANHGAALPPKKPEDIRYPTGRGAAAFYDEAHLARLKEAILMGWTKQRGAMGLTAVLHALNALAYGVDDSTSLARHLAPDWSGDMLNALLAAQADLGAERFEGKPEFVEEVLRPGFTHWGLNLNLNRCIVNQTGVTLFALHALKKAARETLDTMEPDLHFKAWRMLVIDELEAWGDDASALLPALLEMLRKHKIAVVLSRSGKFKDASSLSSLVNEVGNVLLLQQPLEANFALGVVFGKDVAEQTRLLRTRRDRSTLLWVQNGRALKLHSAWPVDGLTTLLCLSPTVGLAYAKSRLAGREPSAALRHAARYLHGVTSLGQGG